jgi:hypothetical protein
VLRPYETAAEFEAAKDEAAERNYSEDSAAEGGDGGNGVEIQAAFGKFDEEVLGVEAMAIAEMSEASGFVEANVFAVRQQHARLQGVGEIGPDHFIEELVAEHGVLQTHCWRVTMTDIRYLEVGALWVLRVGGIT